MAERMCWAVALTVSGPLHVMGVFKQLRKAIAYAKKCNSFTELWPEFANDPLQWVPTNTLRKDAVLRLRLFIFHRDKEECVACGQALTWEAMEMHEKVSRGKGGDMTIDNCETRCHDCHTGKPGSAHGNRRPKFARRVQ